MLENKTTDDFKIPDYEFMGSPIKNVMDTWREVIGDPLGKEAVEVWTPKLKWFKPPHKKWFRWAYKIDWEWREPKHTFDMIHESWNPKWKWVKKLRIPVGSKLFKWAFDIKKTLYKDCYPISINGGNNSEINDAMEVEFKATPYKSPEVNKLAQELFEKYKLNSPPPEIKYTPYFPSTEEKLKEQQELSKRFPDGIIIGDDKND